MAVTKTITGDGGRKHHTFTLKVDETATSTTANTSTLSYTFSIGYKSGAGTGWTWSSEGTNISYTVTINGTQVASGYIPNYSGGTVSIATGTTTVTHDAGGAKTCTIAFAVNDRDEESYTCGDASGSGSMTLTTITVANYTLTISAGTGSTITVNRTSSPKGGGATGNLSSGAKIYYSDVLKITFAASTGYNLGTHTVNNTTFTSGNTHTVTAAVTVKSTATVKSFTLTKTQGTNTTLTINRTSSPKGGASTGNLATGATIYYSDVLKITVSPGTGYNGSVTVNGSAFTSGNSHTVTAATTVVSSATVKSFTLTKTQGTNTTLTINRTSSPKGGAATGNLATGATIYYSDVLKITVSATTGYNGSIKVNNSAFTSGNSHTVTAATTVVSSASVKSFTLTKTQGANTTLTINRTSSPKGGAATGNLATGATIYYSDVLKITVSPGTGYNASITVNGSAFTSGNSHTVTAAATVVSSATVKSFTLTKTQGANTTLTVNRTSSPKQGAATGALSDGATIYYSDELTITATPETGYSASLTVNSASFVSGSTHTVTAAATVVSAAVVLSYLLSISADSNSIVTVNRTSSPKQGASTGEISPGAVIYYSDVLQITFAAATGYQILTHTVNGADFVSGSSHTVIAAVAIVATSGMAGDPPGVYIFTNSGTPSFAKYSAYIYYSGSWHKCTTAMHNGTSWQTLH